MSACALVRARAIAVLGAAIVACGSATPQGEPIVTGSAALGVRLAVDRASYAPGDTAQATFAVFNHSSERVALQFTSGQRYDMVLERPDGSSLWRWAEARGFIQALGEEVVGPGREELSYHISVPVPERSGTYRLRGILTSSSHPLTATVMLEVRS